MSKKGIFLKSTVTAVLLGGFLPLAEATSIEENSIFGFSGTQTSPNAFFTAFLHESGSPSIVPFFNVTGGQIEVGALQDNGLIEHLTIRGSFNNHYPSIPANQLGGTSVGHLLPAAQHPHPGQGVQIVQSAGGTHLNTNSANQFHLDVGLRYENLSVGVNANGEQFLFTNEFTSPALLTSTNGSPTGFTLSSNGDSANLSVFQAFMPSNLLGNFALQFGDPYGTGEFGLSSWIAANWLMTSGDFHIYDNIVRLPGGGTPPGGTPGSDVPEPASMLLLAMGLVSLSRKRLLTTGM